MNKSLLASRIRFVTHAKGSYAKEQIIRSSSRQTTRKYTSFAGDSNREREFEKLYLESYPLVYNYVSYRMVGAAEVEDIVSEAFLLAARSFDTFDPHRAKFSTWVTKIAINCMNSYWRKAHQTADIDDVPEGMLATPSSAEDVANRDMVERLLTLLDDEEREIIVMKFREGYKNTDIAAALNKNASTVSTIVSRALSKMREAMEDTD